MNKEQLRRVKEDAGFIAALDQSGGSTPKALKLYGILEDKYSNEDEMFELMHEMRTRIIKSPAFNKEHILGAILFEKTMNSKIDGKYTGDYLWEEKGIVPFLKVDEGLEALEDGVQLMKEMKGIEKRLESALEHKMFGTKMRSVIKEYNEEGIDKIVKQQFECAKYIFDKGLVPIIEPEVDIHSKDKAKIEEYLKKALEKALKETDESAVYMFKLTLPEEENLYESLLDYPQIIKIVALSGGYSREDANLKLSKNRKVIASFSRGLTEGLLVSQSDEDFDKLLEEAITSIAEASK